MTPVSYLVLTLCVIALAHSIGAIVWCRWLDHLDRRDEQRELDEVIARVRGEMGVPS